MLAGLPEASRFEPGRQQIGPDGKGRISTGEADAMRSVFEDVHFSRHFGGP